MFTGIVEEVGTVHYIKKQKNSATLCIYADVVLEELKQGDSIAVNGVCLTVVEYGENWFSADVMHETINRSSLWGLKAGDRVNLERAMLANGRFGGHIVAGHIDGTGCVQAIEKDEIAICYTIRTSPEIMHYLVEKGSIAIDGISLTISKVQNQSFCVSVIPHTAKHTTLADRKVGDAVNLENDCIGKYVKKLLGTSQQAGGISRHFLTAHGF